MKRITKWTMVAQTEEEMVAQILFVTQIKVEDISPEVWASVAKSQVMPNFKNIEETDFSGHRVTWESVCEYVRPTEYAVHKSPLPEGFAPVWVREVKQ